MAIPAPTVNAVLSIIDTAFRLTGRIDRILTEEAAVRSELALPSHPVIYPPAKISMKRDLQSFLQATREQTSDPPAPRRQELELLLQGSPDEGSLLAFMEEFLPEKVRFKVDDPNQELLQQLRLRSTGLGLNEEAVVRIAFYLNAGDDLRRASLPWQIAMSVMEALFDVAVQNQALLLRDDRARPILSAVVQRFADVDFSAAGSSRIVFRRLLKATVNGVLDAQDELAGDTIWLTSLLSALSETRQSAGDDFLLELIAGSGYPILIASLMREGAGYLDHSNARAFELIAADMFKHAAAIVQERSDFRDFFATHWVDLLQAALHSVHSNGETILQGESPLLQSVLLKAVEALAAAGKTDLLSGAVLEQTLEAAIGAVVLQPQLLEEVTDSPWITRIIESVSSVLSTDLRGTMTAEGVVVLITTLLRDFSKEPELLIQDAEILQTVLGSMLISLASSNRPRLDAVAVAAAKAVLARISESPELLQTSYPAAVARIAAELGTLLDKPGLRRKEFSRLLVLAAEILAENPRIVLDQEDTLAAEVLHRSLEALLRHQQGMVTSRTLRAVLAAVLHCLAENPACFTRRRDLSARTISSFLESLSKQLEAENTDLSIGPLLRAGLTSCLEAAAANPDLFGVRYGEAVGQVAGELAKSLQDGTITSSEAEELVQVTAELAAANVRVLIDKHSPLLGLLLASILKTMATEGGLHQESLLEVYTGSLRVLAGRIELLLGQDSLERLVERVQAVLKAGLEKVEQELGRTIRPDMIPSILLGLLQLWADDRLPSLKLDEAGFTDRFQGLVQKFA